jgi:hypothetical protein
MEIMISLGKAHSAHSSSQIILVILDSLGPEVGQPKLMYILTYFCLSLSFSVLQLRPRKPKSAFFVCIDKWATEDVGRCRKIVEENNLKGFYFYFYFFGSNGVWTLRSGLLGNYSTTWATPPVPDENSLK